MSIFGSFLLALETKSQPGWWSFGIVVVAISMLFYILKRPSVYLLDYSCVKYGDEHKASLEVLHYFMQALGSISVRDGIFQLKVFLKSGIGEEAYIPRATLEKGRHSSMQDSRNQVHFLVVEAVDELLKKTGVAAADVDIVIVNSGLFNPSPSLTSLLVNYFKMKTDVRTFQLGGMGCSAGLIAVDLAKDLLSLHRNKYALIASTEVIQQFYDGKERSMMVANCLFRSAGTALLLSNRKSDKSWAKLVLLHSVRVNTAAQDEAHNCVVVKEDQDEICGAQLEVNLVEVAGNALRLNIQKLAPRVLPLGELWKVAYNGVQRKLLKRSVGQYVPDFKLAFDHFCIHPGGRAVVEAIGKSLSLTQHDIEPALMALNRFGNMSCAGVWYVLAYCEAKKRLKKGDKVWQIGLGSGFKCNTSVWKVLRTIDDPVLECSPWQDCIHRYPVGHIGECAHVKNFVEFLNNKTLKGLF